MRTMRRNGSRDSASGDPGDVVGSHSPHQRPARARVRAGVPAVDSGPGRSDPPSERYGHWSEPLGVGMTTQVVTVVRYAESRRGGLVVLTLLANNIERADELGREACQFLESQNVS